MFVYKPFGIEMERMKIVKMEIDRMEMNCTISNHLKLKCPTLFTILRIGHLGHFNHSKWSKWPEIGVPNDPFIYLILSH